MPEKRVSIRINFDEMAQAQIEFLCKKFSLTATHDLIRYLILTTYKKEKDNDLRYGISPRIVKKEERDEQIRNLQSMSDQELTVWLAECGFSPPPVEDRGNIESYEMRNGMYCMIIRYKDPSIPDYVSQRFDKNQLIRELIKEKKI